ncbi:8-oxo-dGTP diphosphatase [Salipaludibacillus agaradhaerens]|uniref:8-oxo-dGTP diphosphatase n=1 Tax=Salipaludibacillus agaradhaerens TaxID=76935 RepID=A0A9Q4B0U9_SALAG|nr:8-oxo-dGTP diphosphatase [Salipaludibacillus agaradhaerens]MCR6096254.1 8-oxo-dGTP diphosphatase [Salipaludibacillus agaradhaerens]MCR6114187.1 8-oxo-dGTP diphosphatase [Salipaludibacillus agaradhaerens]
MSESVNYKFWTVCLVQNGDYVLLLNRQHDNFKGYIPPGGKVEFPESFTEAAIREVKEETGLEVSDLIYKGLYEYVNPEKNDRYMIFNYITKCFSGTLLEDTHEGKPVWVNKNEIPNLSMQGSIRRRFPLFFEDGTFEIQVEWDNEKNQEGEVTIKKT